LEVPFWHPSQPFKVCGLAKKNTMNLVLPLSIVNAFKYYIGNEKQYMSTEKITTLCFRGKPS
jgi:hypothetical protein